MRPTAGWPVDKLEYVSSCPVCGDRSRSKLYADLTDRLLYGAPGTWSLYKCLGCGSVYLDPRPTAESIRLAYKHYYTHNPTSFTTKPSKLPLANLRLSLRNGYINKRYGYHLKPASVLGYFLAPLFPTRKFQEDRWLRHLSYPRQNPNLLDVGCSNGSFLLQMQSLGWLVQGIDPDPNAVTFAKQAGIYVFQGTLADIKLQENYFDAITINHVIEHIHNPISTLQACYLSLRPGGFLWIATPNLNAFGHRKFGEHWRGLEPPRHLVLFTPNSLKSLIERVGFGVTSGFLPTAAWITEMMFSSSHLIARGINPNNTKTISFGLRWKARLHNIWTWLHPELSEELILLAKKPTNSH